jgi:putative ABC transport system permease protein
MAAVDPLFLFFALVLAAVAIVSLALALAHRMEFRLALRNVRRGRTRTALLLLGLLVGTTIVSSSLIVGDTVGALNVHFTYQAFGFTDEAVTNQTPAAGYPFFPAAVFPALAAHAQGTPGLKGLTPEIVGSVSALDRTTGIPQANLNLIGVDPSAAALLGSFTTDSGASLAGPAPGSVLLDAQAASDLNATAGHTLVLYGRSTVVAVVQAVVRDDTRGGFLFGGNVFVPLALAQTLENASGRINYIAATNQGSLQDAVGVSDSVSAALNRSLLAIGAPPGLAAQPVLAQNLAVAQANGSSLTTLFLVLGLFSIVAGGMLIVGIFVMLAEERKGEMGMLRAIGLKRRSLVLTYYFEGLAYSAGSALAGTILGVGVGYGLTYAFSVIFSSGSVTSAAILESFTVTTRSLVIGYVVGFLLTLVTVAVASARASRLNIVRAIRSVPEPAPTLRLYTRLAYAGIAVAAVGAYLFGSTYRGSGDLSYPIVGLALVLVGIAMFASRFLPNRFAFSAAGAGLLVWGGTEPLHTAVLGTSHGGTIFVFFVDGILMVVGAILLYVFNSDLVVRAVTALTGVRPSSVPIVRVGLSYPSRRPFRTAVNLTIFALVLFTVVGVAAFGSSLQAALNETVTYESGGYTFFGTSSTPIPDLPARIAANATLARDFSHVVPIVSGATFVNFSGLSSAWPDGIYAAPTTAAPSSNFYATNRFNFTSTLGGLTTAQVWSRLASDPTAAVVDHAYAGGGFSSIGTSHPVLSVGTTVRVTGTSPGVTRTVTVIGIMSQDFVSGIWVNPATAASLGFVSTTSYFFAVAPGISPTLAAQAAKIAFFPYGLVLVDFQQVLQSSIQSTEAVIGLLEIFVALGLGVGIAAMGIVALRAVVERRSEIGMLRAIGLLRSGVLRVFLLEYSYVALLGILIGATLGILVVYNAVLGTQGLLAFAVPWPNVALILAVSYALTVAAIAGPSLRASRLPPAEAIRYSE